jgi:hypothetical protein
MITSASSFVRATYDFQGSGSGYSAYACLKNDMHKDLRVRNSLKRKLLPKGDPVKKTDP